MLADLVMRTGSARWLIFAPPMAKCCATDTAMSVATDAVQVSGGYGFMEDNPIAEFFRDAEILQNHEGTDQIQRMVIARSPIEGTDELAHLADCIPEEVQNPYREEAAPTAEEAVSSKAPPLV